MKSRKKPDDQPSPADPAKKTPKAPSMPGGDTPTPTAEGSLGGNPGRLTADEWKQVFVKNLDQLVRLVGLSRKDAAREMHVSYRLLRRLITAGVSRTDVSNLTSLKRIADYFCMQSVEDLWNPHVVTSLIFSIDSKFKLKFAERLRAEREKRLQQDPDRRVELVWLNHALGYEDRLAPSLPGGTAHKVFTILGSARGTQFQRIIDDYYELVKLSRSGEEG
jgi:hypothetical protein